MDWNQVIGAALLVKKTQDCIKGFFLVKAHACAGVVNKDDVIEQGSV